MRTLPVLRTLAPAVALLVAGRASAQTSLDKLSFYGFLNQGYGVANAQPILGLNRDASGDYRAASLQVRYALSPEDNFVLQAGSRSLGTSPLSPAAGAVSLDWAFYHHHFDFASLRIGRMPVPFGFLSETRDVGTLLPFYRAPAGYYLEAFRSLEGGMINRDVEFAGGSLEGTAFAGGTTGNYLTWTPTVVVNTRLRLERMLGADLTWRTPIEGIRLRGGFATARSLDTAKVQLAPATKWNIVSTGAEAHYDRLLLRGEARRIKVGSNQKIYSTYAQAGVRLLDRLTLNGQLDLGSSEQYVAPLNSYVGRASADRALGLAWQFTPAMVAKLEQHFAQGAIDGYVATNAETPYTNYSIASFAVSF